MSLGNLSGRLLCVCLLASVLTIQVSSAQGTGTMKGKVYDRTSREELPAANILVKGTGIGTVANLDGAFTLHGIPSGSQTIVVSYIGYNSSTVVVNVPENETVIQDFFLAATTLEGEEVVVTAQAQGQLQAINQQLSSNKIVSVVSESKIQELPDFNAAAAIGRLPGVSTTKSSGEDNKVVIRGLSPQYNSIEVEGVTLSATGSSNIGLTSDIFVTTPGVQNDRSVDLTMVSPYMIRTISVYKSLTPDMNANSIGGTVNMELREAPTGLQYDLLYQQGHTAKSNTYGNYRAVASGSNRFLDNKLGVYALFNVESYDRDADNLNAVYDIAGSIKDSATGYRPVEVNTVTSNRHIENRDRYGANLILDYALDNGSIKFSNMFARLNSDYTDHNQTLNYDNGRMEWRLQIGENITDQQLHSLKLDYDLGFVNMDLSAGYTSASNVLENSPVLNFNQVGGVLIQDRDNKKPEEISMLARYGGDTNVVLRSGNLFSNDYKEVKFLYKADFEVPFTIGTDVNGFIKIGGQFNIQSNVTDQEAPYLAFDGDATPDPNGQPNIANDMMRAIRDKFGITINNAGEFVGRTFLNPDGKIFDPFLGNSYGNIYFASSPILLTNVMNYIVGNPSFDASDASLSNGREGGWYDGPYQQLTNDYTYDEKYYAGYAMSTINILDFIAIGGVRYEKVRSDYFAYNARDVRNVQIQKMYDTTSANENEFVLPMGQIKYSPFDWMDVRYAYTQTLSRPDYQTLTPKFTITQGNEIIAGNPDLKPAKSFNHDVNVTFYSKELGLITLGFFYKTIQNFVFNASYQLDVAQKVGIDSLPRYQVWRDENGDGVLEAVVNPVSLQATVRRPLNNPYDATVKGFEIDFQHSLWYLPSPFNNIVLGSNYTRIYSETKYPFYRRERIPGTIPPQFTLFDSSATGRLINQPNHVMNAYAGYDYKGFSVRISFLFTDNQARNNGGEYPENDSYTTEYFRTDISARQKLPFFNSELFLDVSNVNDEYTSWIQKSSGGFQGIQNYGLTANLGLRLKY